MTETEVIKPPRGFSEICSIMVTYFPEAEVASNARAILEQVDHLIVVDNGTSDLSFLQSGPFQKPHCTVIRWNENFGIAAALNEGVRAAIKMGYKWVLTMDQDSRLPEGCIEEMIHVWSTCGSRSNIAMVGPNYEGANRFQTATSGALEHTSDYAIVKEIITSGTLMPTTLFESIGEFREDLFIDMVDIEFCLRARRRGFSVAVALKTRMQHQLGSTKALPWIGGISSHPPLRNYYRFRNSVLIIKEAWGYDWHFVFSRSKKMLLIAVKIVLFERPWLKNVSSVARGICHGLIGRSGKAEGIE
ncbi:MAG: glycosyltransferase family 2 protein [Halioglobus sp.]